jgi:hypothetical protein
MLTAELSRAFNAGEVMAIPKSLLVYCSRKSIIFGLSLANTYLGRRLDAMLFCLLEMCR